MFFDEVSLELEGGQGGNGMVSFHREKFVAYGPPDGGDGGDGGRVIIEADSNYNTFRHFSGKKHFKAERGQGGHKNNRAGRTGEDIVLKVPVGTLVHDKLTGEVLVDLKIHGQTFVAAKGGRGGYGNAHFVSSTRQAPKFAELGDVGEQREVRLEMQLMADVGLVGFPSAGKSTLISHVSGAKPKIGDYPFTTLVPNLGVVNLSQFGASEQQSFVIADIPGIIEGASEGKGLGHDFLKHISRTATLVYLLDPFHYEDLSMEEQYRILKGELEKYNKGLLAKDCFVVMNKIDAIPHEDREELKANFMKAFSEVKAFYMISGVSGEGLDTLMFDLWNLIQKSERSSLKSAEMQEEAVTSNSEVSDEGTPEYMPVRFVDEQSFEVSEMYEVDAGSLREPILNTLIAESSKPKRMLFRVSGERIEQISRMTNTEQEGGVQRVYDVLKKMGIHDALLRQGAKTGDYVKIGPHFFEFHDI